MPIYVIDTRRDVIEPMRIQLGDSVEKEPGFEAKLKSQRVNAGTDTSKVEIRYEFSDLRTASLRPRTMEKGVGESDQ